MFCLIYRSVASPSFKQSDIKKMLEKARLNNEELGITGCLLYYQGEFIQYLEGNQIKVLELYDKIKADKRHTDVELISYAEREMREFHLNWKYYSLKASSILDFISSRHRLPILPIC